MNKDTLKGDWNMMKGKIKEKWGKLTDNDITEINGKKDQLMGKLQKEYGYDKERAEKEISDWENSCSSCCSSDKEKEKAFKNHH